MNTKSLRKDLRRVLLPYWVSPSRWRGWCWLTLLLVLLLVISYINIRISYAERSVFTALELKDAAVFWRNLFMYAVILVSSVPVVGSFGWVKAKLELAWREWLTKHIIDRYLANRNFFHVSPDKVDNPDERVQQDVTYFCTEVMTLTMAVLDSSLAFLAFVTILYLISPTLLVVAIGYSILGTVTTVLFGRRLIGMHYEQQKLEAEFRYNLVYLRDNAEPIALYNAAEREKSELNNRLMALLRNMNSIASWQRNLTLFKTSYDYSLLIIPALISAPLYLSGQIQLGMMVQAGTAFGRVIGALSVVIVQYQTFARLAAITSRLSDFVGVLEDLENGSEKGLIVTEKSTILSVKDLTVMTRDSSRTLVKNLTFKLEAGKRLLVTGPSGVGKSSLIRALVGLWTKGDGTIRRPDLEDMLVLPQTPYLTLGSLRDQLTYPKEISEPHLFDDARMRAVLEQVNLGELEERVGGLGAVHRYNQMLSHGERQRIAIARMLYNVPKLTFLDEATSALDYDNEMLMYRLVAASGATIVSVAHRKELLEFHDTVLELLPQGGWRLVPMNEYKQD